MFKDKIQTRDELKILLDNFKIKGKKIGFTSGVFDIIHAGHIDFLQQAKKSCDVLVVGLNSDNSVKKYKGENRPIINEKYRLITIAALEMVDFVFLFDERRNKKNIEILKPHFYFKAGDYKKEQLTSAEIVEKYGGEVKIIKISYDISTTKIIEKILEIGDVAKQNFIYDEKEKTGYFKLNKLKPKPAIFLDRDGTINEEIEYLHDPKKFKLIKNAGEGLKQLQDMGYYLIIITNQAGIGLGYFTVEDFFKVNKAMFKALAPYNVIIDRIYFCPHSINDNCNCRKPKIGFIERAKDELNIDLKNSFFIGDKTVDIMTAKNAGIKSILVKTGHAGKDKVYDVEPDYIVNDLKDAAQLILSIERK